LPIIALIYTFNRITRKANVAARPVRLQVIPDCFSHLQTRFLQAASAALLRVRVKVAQARMKCSRMSWSCLGAKSMLEVRC
jgi:hypothetical protein